MTNFYTLTRTELAEAAKEYKFIWLTLFFIILGVTQPLVNNYMDVILENMGAADGITIDPNRPVPSSGEVLLSTISGQFNQIGLIILIISFMGLIAADRNSGMQDFILTRPVSISSYLLSKLTAHWLISMFAIAMGAVVSYGYTIFLFGPFSFSDFLLFLLMYSLWILYVISLAILISVFIKGPILIAVTTIAVSIFFILIKGFNHLVFQLSPGGVLNVAENQLLLAREVNHFSILSCVLFIVFNMYLTKKNIYRQ
ncbi:ABC transporter permease [Planococcus sp. SSTMD024]|uniref:ABC transporter permease n=1 Tax=Planococcus sp. SSTMD024 TaxID=3242163 RepID=UPI00351F4CA1